MKYELRFRSSLTNGVPDTIEDDPWDFGTQKPVQRHHQMAAELAIFSAKEVSTYDLLGRLKRPRISVDCTTFINAFGSVSMTVLRTAGTS